MAAVWRPKYIEDEDLADYVRGVDPGDEPLLGPAIAAASRAIDRSANRQFGKNDTPVQRTYPTRPWRGRRVAVIDDLMTVEDLVIAGGVTDYDLLPANAAADGRPWERIVLPIDVCLADITAGWGWLAFPESVVAAARLQSSRFFARRDSPYGVAGSPDVGSEIRLLARVDPDVKVMLTDVRRARRVR